MENRCRLTVPLRGQVGDAAAVVIMERLDRVILTVVGAILMTLLTRFFWSTFSPALIY